MSKRILAVMGHNADAIKLAPLLAGIQAETNLRLVTCHRQSDDEEINNTYHFFRVGRHGQLKLSANTRDESQLMSDVLAQMREILRQEMPQLLLVNGGSTIGFAAALAAHFESIPIAHIESNLHHSSVSIESDEFNRGLIRKLAHLHLVPTKSILDKLIQQNMDKEHIWVTGCLVREAVQFSLNEVKQVAFDSYYPDVLSTHVYTQMMNPTRNIILFKDSVFQIEPHDEWQRIIHLAHQNPDWEFVFIDSEHSLLSHSEIAHWKIKNIHCVGAVEFQALIWFVNNADIVVSESELVCDSARELGKHLINSVDLALDTPPSEFVGVGEVERKRKRLSRLIQMANHLEVIMPDPDLCQNYSGKMISDEAASRRTGNSSVRILNILMEQFSSFSEDTDSTVRVA